MHHNCLKKIIELSHYMIKKKQKRDFKLNIVCLPNLPLNLLKGQKYR